MVVEIRCRGLEWLRAVSPAVGQACVGADDAISFGKSDF